MSQGYTKVTTAIDLWLAMPYPTNAPTHTKTKRSSMDPDASQRQEEHMSGSVSSAPKQITWIISLALFIVALLGTFGAVAQINGEITQWAWIIGFALILVATKVKDL